jgi:hypothetical protein
MAEDLLSSHLGVTPMTRRFALLTLVVLLLVPAALTVASAAELVTPLSLGASYGCLVNNVSATKEITVSVWVKDDSGATLSACENVPVLPEHGIVCPSAGDVLAYCRIATTSAVSTRASFLSLDSSGNVTTLIEAK